MYEKHMGNINVMQGKGWLENPPKHNEETLRREIDKAFPPPPPVLAFVPSIATLDNDNGTKIKEVVIDEAAHMEEEGPPPLPKGAKLVGTPPYTYDDLKKMKKGEILSNKLLSGAFDVSASSLNVNKLRGIAHKWLKKEYGDGKEKESS